jgi:hypothetical protein
MSSSAKASFESNFEATASANATAAAAAAAPSGPVATITDVKRGPAPKPG